MEMRHQPLFLADQAPELLVDLDRIERGEAQARQVGDQREESPHELAERRLSRQIGAEGGDVDTAQHDLAIAGGDNLARLLDDGAERQRAAVAPAEGYDAEGAAVIAALLHLDEGAAVSVETLDEMSGRLAHAHDVGDGDARRRSAIGGDVALGPQL